MTQHKTDSHKSDWGYALLAMVLYLLLGMDAFSVFVIGPLLDGQPLHDASLHFNNWYARAGANFFSTALWTITALLVIYWLKQRNALDKFLGTRFDGRSIGFFAIGIIVLIAIIRSVAPAESPWLRFVAENRRFEELYPGNGLMVTIIQHLYYIAESAMVVLVLAAWQRAGEIWTKKTLVPWGGLGLALTWGISHGLWGIIPSLVIGVIFVSTQKNALLSLVSVLMLFVVYS